MSVILILIAFSLVVAIIFLVAFIWAVKNGQYEDDYTPSVRILFDDDKPSGGENKNEEPPNSNQDKNLTKE